LRKVCVVVSSHTDYVGVKTIMQAIKEHEDLELQFIVGGSALLERFGASVNYMIDDGFAPDAQIYMEVEGDNLMTMAKTVGLAIIETAVTLERLQPDIVLIVGDRYETISAAIAASYMNIPLAQTMCGEISGTIDEHIRHAITKLAHIHFPATRLSEQRILRMGEDPEHVYMVGCPTVDRIINGAQDDNLDIFDRFKGVGGRLDLSEPFLLAMQHPVTTEYQDARRQIEETLSALQTLKMPTIMIWPNIDAGHAAMAKGIRTFRENNEVDNWLHMFKNLPPDVFLNLLDKCACLIGNSNCGIREAPALGTPVVNIGTRQKGRERASNVIDVDYNRHKIIDAILTQYAHGKYTPNFLYGDGRAGKRIADILATCELNINKRMTY